MNTKKQIKNKKSLKDKPLADLPEIPENEKIDPEIAVFQTMNQNKIALAQSPLAPYIVELVKDVLKQVPLVGKDQWETMKNAIIIDTSTDILRDLVDHLEEIKRGSLIGKK